MSICGAGAGAGGTGVGAAAGAERLDWTGTGSAAGAGATVAAGGSGTGTAPYLRSASTSLKRAMLPGSAVSVIRTNATSGAVRGKFNLILLMIPESAHDCLPAWTRR